MAILNDVLGTEWLSAAGPAVAATIAKAALILVLGGLCALASRRASSATRHMIWTLSLAGSLTVPVLAAIVPHWNVPILRSALSDAGLPVLAPAAPLASTAPLAPTAVLPALIGASSNAVLALGAPRRASSRPRDIVRQSPALASSEPVVGLPSVNGPEPAPSVWASRGAPAAPTLGAWVIVVWLLGAIAALIPPLVGMLHLAALGRRARVMRGGRWALLVPTALREIGIRRRVRFVELDDSVMPMTWGVIHPVVLLPAGDFGSTIAQRLDVLRHELAHVRRYDCLTQLIGQVACAAYWFNPLVWIAARQLRIERERACDDEVLRAGAKASEYADYLLRVARSTRLTGAAAFGALAMARPSQLAGRLLAVLDDRRRRSRLSASAAARASLAAALIVGAIGAVTPTSASARAAIVATTAPEQRVTTTTTENGFGVAPLALDKPNATGTPRVDVATVGVSPLASVGGDAPLPASVLRLADFAAAPAPVPVPVTPRAEECDRAARKRGSSSHSQLSSSDDGPKRWRVLWSEGDCSYELEARGDIKYNRDVTDVESISSGGSFTLAQHVGDDTKRLTIRPHGDGTLERSYFVNGARQEYDAAARTWFAEALTALDRQTAFAVDQRLPAILERGGVDGALREISLIGTDYARRRYFTKLLSMRSLDRTQVRRVVEQAAAEMSSDYEIAELLVALSKLDSFSDESHPAFVAAAGKIESDYERRRALNALLRRDKLAPATVDALLKAAATIDSDYELAELLIDVAKRYAIDDRTRPDYIQAVGSIQSDYEHRRVLMAIIGGGGLTPAVTRSLLEDAKRIESDYELAEFLIAIGKKGALDPSTRDAYFAAADKIGSDYEHRRALTPLLTRDLLTKDLAKAILGSAAKIDSDYECSTLLIALANAIPIDDDLRPAYERAAATIEGEYEYGRAMGAVRQRVTR